MGSRLKKLLSKQFSLVSGMLFLAIGTFIICLLLGVGVVVQAAIDDGYLNFDIRKSGNGYQLESARLQDQNAKTLPHTPMPATEEAVPGKTPAPIQQPSSSQLINCNTHNGVVLLTKEQCLGSIDCNVAGVWSLYPNQESCSQAQKNYYDSTKEEFRNIVENDEKYEESYDDNLIDCTVYYASLNSSSKYRVTEEYCEEAQREAEESNAKYYEILKSYPSTESNYETNEDENNRAVQECENQVASYYSTMLGNCSRQFQGGSGAYDACIHVVEGDRQEALAACY